MPHRRPPKLPPSEYVGAVRIFFTMCTFKRQRHFATRHVAELVQSDLLHSAASEAVEIIAYCLMPDHLHFLSTGSHDGSDTLRFVRRFRQRTGFACRRTSGIALWQEGY